MYREAAPGGEFSTASSWGFSIDIHIVQTATPTLYVTLMTSDRYFGGKRLAPQDRLGSVGDFYPYGEAKGSNNPQDTWSYATYWRDSASGLDYAKNRYYSNAYGRFMTPDPYKANNSAAGDPSDPGSWNKYAYTRGDPVNRIDPMGMGDEPPTFTVTTTATADAPPFYPSDPGHPNWPLPYQPNNGEEEAKKVPNPCSNTQAVAFFKSHLADATKLAGELGVPVQFVLAVSFAESTGGTSDGATIDNNYFGIHWGDGGPAAFGATQSTRNPVFAAWPSGTDGYFSSGSDFVSIAASDNASGVTNASQFFADIHKQFGVGTADYVQSMVQVAAMTALRLKCP